MSQTPSPWFGLENMWVTHYVHCPSKGSRSYKHDWSQNDSRSEQLRIVLAPCCSVCDSSRWKNVSWNRFSIALPSIADHRFYKFVPLYVCFSLRTSKLVELDSGCNYQRSTRLQAVSGRRQNHTSHTHTHTERELNLRFEPPTNSTCRRNADKSRQAWGINLILKEQLVAMQQTYRNQIHFGTEIVPCVRGALFSYKYFLIVFQH